MIAALLAMASTHASALDGIMKQLTFGCRTEADFKLLARLISGTDRAASRDFLLRKGVSGECTVFKAGERVFYDRGATPIGLVLIRTPELPGAYYIYRHTVDFK